MNQIREITAHRGSLLNNAITINGDERDANGGSHTYTMVVGKEVQQIDFQNGPTKEAGLNGISNEALIAIVIDRLEGFQTGPYRCRENALAITKLEKALHWLNHRTKQREARGVEGTHRV